MTQITNRHLKKSAAERAAAFGNENSAMSEPRNDKLPTKTTIKLAVLLMFVGLISYLMDHVVIARSASVDPSVFWPTSGKIERGDYVTFDFQHELIKGGRPYKLTKRVACLPGEQLILKGEYHYCNGKKLGRVLMFGESGVPLPAFEYSGNVPDGKVFLSGEHPSSFDSRYWGFISISELSKMKPIF